MSSCFGWGGGGPVAGVEELVYCSARMGIWEHGIMPHLSNTDAHTYHTPVICSVVRYL